MKRADWLKTAMAIHADEDFRWAPGMLPHWTTGRPLGVKLEHRIIGVDPHHGPWSLHGYLDLDDAVPDVRDWATWGVLNHPDAA